MPVKCPKCGGDLALDRGAGRLRCPRCKAELRAEAAAETVALSPAQARAMASTDGLAGASPPARIGHYQILGMLGRGGMGVVYKAYDPELKRTVALKVLLSAEHASKDEIERFSREASSAAKLQHPNIVPIHELKVYEGRHFYTMDLIEGQPLDRLIAEGKLGIRQSLELLEKVARALHHAHSRGIIHRDLKPANIIVGPDGEPKVTDFGLAKVLTGDEHSATMEGLTGSGVALGSIHYESPEQAAGRSREVDARSDVYSLGCILYEMVAGVPPFRGGGALEVMRMQVETDPVAPTKLGAKISIDVETICLKSLEKDPGRRYQSAGELADDLRSFLAGEPISARPASVIYIFRKKLGRHKAVFAALAVAVTVLAGLSAWFVSAVRAERESRARVQRELDAQRLADECSAEQAATQARDEARRAGEAVGRGNELLRQASGCRQEAEAGKLLARAEAEFQAALVLSKDDPRGREGLCRAALQHFELAFKHKNWVQAWEKIEQARAAGLPEKQCAASLKRIEDAKASEGLMSQVASLTRGTRFDEAIAACSEAIKLNPQNAAAYRERAEARRAKKDLAGSIPDYDRAIELAPDDAAAYHGRGHARPGADIAAALRDFDEAVGLKPDSVEYHGCRGRARLQSGKLDEAIADFDKVLSLDPRTTTVYHDRGHAYEKKRDWDASLRDFDKLLAMAPQPNHYRCRATVREAKGDLRGAAQDLERVLAVGRKDDPHAPYHLLQILVLETKGGAKAAEVRSRVEDFERGATVAGWPAKLLAFFKGEVDEPGLLGAAESPDAGKRKEQLCEACYYAGIARLAKGDRAGAKELFKRCLATGAGTFTEHRAARRELVSLGEKIAEPPEPAPQPVDVF